MIDDFKVLKYIHNCVKIIKYKNSNINYQDLNYI